VLVLRERTGDDRVEVLNAGVPGYTTFESLRNLRARVLQEKPRLVVVYHAINDLHVRRAARYLPDNAGYRHPWREPTRPHLFIVRHSYFARWLGFRVGLRPLSVEEYTRFEPDMSAEPPESLLEERPPIYFRENLGELVRTARAAGAEVALTTFAANPAVDHYVKYAFYRRGLAEMNQVIREVAKRERTLFVDVDGRLSRDVALWADGVHLDARGSRAHAEIVGDALAATPSWMRDEASTETKIE
jgi:lysophospholipase L1-like esterase